MKDMSLDEQIGADLEAAHQLKYIQECIDQTRQDTIREMLGKLNKRDVGGIYPEWAMCDKDYKEYRQSLGEKK